MSRRLRSRFARVNSIRRRRSLSMPDELDDCPICQEFLRQRVPYATLDLRGNLVRIDEPPPAKQRSILVRLLVNEGSRAVDVSLPEASNGRHLLDVIGSYVSIGERELTRAGNRLHLDDPLEDGALLRLTHRHIDGSHPP